MTKNLLLHHFKKVDMFDLCEEAVKTLKKLKKSSRKIEHIDQANMMTYNFKCKYDAIFLTWVIGYLDDEHLREFLVKAASHLRTKSQRKSRKNEP